MLLLLLLLLSSSSSLAVVEEKELAGRGCCTKCLPAEHHPNPSSRKLVCDYPNHWELEEWAVLAAGTR